MRKTGLYAVSVYGNEFKEHYDRKIIDILDETVACVFVDINYYDKMTGVQCSSVNLII